MTDYSNLMDAIHILAVARFNVCDTQSVLTKPSSPAEKMLDHAMEHLNREAERVMRGE